MREDDSVEVIDAHFPKCVSDRLVASLWVTETSCIVEPRFAGGGLDKNAGSMSDVEERDGKSALSSPISPGGQ